MTGAKLIAIDPTESFSLYVKFAVMGGLLIASPLVMSQVWLFIAPGLYAHEKKLAIPFVLLSSVCLVAGAAFGHFVVFPMIWSFLAELGKAAIFNSQPRIDTTFALYLKIDPGLRGRSSRCRRSCCSWRAWDWSRRDSW